MDRRIAEDDTGIVDQHVDVAVPGEDRRNHPFPVLDPRHVEMLEFDARRQAVGRRVLGIGGDNNGAGFREERGDGEADALRGAGDESNFSVETIYVGFLRFSASS